MEVATLFMVVMVLWLLRGSGYKVNGCRWLNSSEVEVDLMVLGNLYRFCEQLPLWRGSWKVQKVALIVEGWQV